MNKTSVAVGGIIVILLIAGVFFWMNPDSIPSFTNATSTPAEVNDDGTPVGETPVQGAAPVATTNSTFAPTDTTAVVTGTVQPHGAITSYWYEFGTTPTLGQQTSKQSVGSGNVAILAPGYITGLTKSTTYYYRLVAENQYGKSTGAQNTLKTSTIGAPVVGVVPVVKTLAANGITKSSATLRGEVNPGKVVTQYWFEYGKTANLGNTTAFVSIGDGDASVSASASPTLDRNTTYHFRINAQNQYGTVNGAIMTFKTDK